MRFILASAVALSSLFSSVAGFNNLGKRDAFTTDVCAEVNAVLQVSTQPGKVTTIGRIQACLCISTLPSFIITNILAIQASALVGKPKTTDLITDMIRGAGNTCNYPPHSVPACQFGNACGFTCKDGYLPAPLLRPTTCACSWPLTECNGKCGLFLGCPSGHARRDIHWGSDKQCPRGQTACGVFGRSAKSWECINTQTDLESCGGCAIPLQYSIGPEGRDCTAIVGVSDVSCVRGGCQVHRCMPGYKVNSVGDSCVYVEEEDPALLAAQYGLEHVPLQ